MIISPMMATHNCINNNNNNLAYDGNNKNTEKCANGGYKKNIIKMQSM
jgi:hypothetical protein